MVSETCFTVRYAETDQMGIVHHSNYAVWFEAGRTDFVRKMGLPYSKVEESGVLLPLIGLKCSFIGIARYEDEIVIKTSIIEAGNIRCRFYYEVFRNSEPKAITTGETEHVWTNRSLKPVNIKKTAPHIYHTIQSAWQTPRDCPQSSAEISEEVNDGG